jgi:hypothetical protein
MAHDATKSSSINHGKLLSHDTELEESYGQPVPQPKLTKGEFVAFGELAGSTSTAKDATAARYISFDDSVAEQKSNLPKGSH